jgi:nifR3 family TIM-barrel protein
MNFWEKLPKPALTRDGSQMRGRPFFCLAPMADVTDAAFRRVITKYGKPDVFWTEFVSADGLMSEGREVLKKNLIYSKKEKPIVVQLFSSNPIKMRQAVKYVASLGFDGIDINMGCPDKSIEKQGCGSAMIKNPERAGEIIQAVKDGIKDSGKKVSISVKTRVGYNKSQLEEWIPFLLSQNIDALTIHARTRKEMSKVPANWDYVKRVVEIRNEMKVKTKIIGNGDVVDIEDGMKKAKETGCDGIMIGRAIFGNPWLFANLACEKRNCQIEHPVLNLPLDTGINNKNKKNKNCLTTQSRNSAERSECVASNESRKFKTGVSTKEKLKVLVEHTKLFEKLLGKSRNFAVMKKHFKAYVNGFDGAKELRVRLMETKNFVEVKDIVDNFLG